MASIFHLVEFCKSRWRMGLKLWNGDTLSQAALGFELHTVVHYQKNLGPLQTRDTSQSRRMAETYKVSVVCWPSQAFPPSSRTLLIRVRQCSLIVRAGLVLGLSRPWSGCYSHHDVRRGQHLTILHTIRGFNDEWGKRQSVAPTMSISCRSALELVAPSELWDCNVWNPSESSTKQPTALIAWVRRSCNRFQIKTLLCLEETKSPSRIGYDGEDSPTWNIEILYFLFNFVIIQMNIWNPHLTHTASARPRSLLAKESIPWKPRSLDGSTW